MIKQISKNKDSILAQYVFPNVIYNRFDLLGLNYDLYNIDKYYIHVEICQNGEKGVNYAHVGLYLSKIPLKLLNRFSDFLFNKYKNIKYIDIKHCYTAFDKNTLPYPYWHVVLPETVDEFNKTLSHRVRYNTKWYPKKIKNDIGDYEIKKYSRTKIPVGIIKQYLTWKGISHDFHFNGSATSFIKTFGITNCYVMYINKETIAVAFICDTGDNVYFENFSYDKTFEKYSIGMVLYYYVICDLIQIHKKIFYLSGGWLDYKRHYNGVLTLTYSGKIYRPDK